MNQKVTTKSLEVEDLPRVARVHIDSFPDSALTRLGPSVVERYYLWQLTGPHEKVRAFGAFVENECAGFSFSGIFNGSTSGFVRQSRIVLAAAALRRPGLFLNSLFLKRLREGSRLLFRSGRRGPDAGQGKKPRIPNYGILSIAVSPRFQKMGIGQLLMRDAEEEALKFGHQELCLTVHPSNEKAVRFYEQQHWKKFVTGELWSGTMIKNLK